MEKNGLELEKIPSEEIAYLAGLLDGDGGITLKRVRKNQKSYKLVVYVINTNIDVLEWIKDRFGGSIYVYRINDGIRKPIGRWKVFTQKAYSVLKLIHPYLIIKKRHAELGLKFVESLNRDASWHEEYAKKLKLIQLRSGGHKYAKEI